MAGGFTYEDCVLDYLRRRKLGEPIYMRDVAAAVAERCNMEKGAAAGAAAVAIKRIFDKERLSDLRRHQKGVYYRAAETPFGELGIDREKLIADKYLLPNEGYETGYWALHRAGLTTLIPNVRLIASNAGGSCIRHDMELDVSVRRGRTEITADNKEYLQLLDMIDLLDRAAIDAENPQAVLAALIAKKDLNYRKLLYLADRHYGRRAITGLAKVARASEGIR